jgi:hypothetical protein
MNETESDADAEIVALAAVHRLLLPLDDDARARVLAYVSTKFGIRSYQSNLPVPVQRAQPERQDTPPATRPASLAFAQGSPLSNEIAGIAHLTEDGVLRLTARDLKAKSTADAAKRITYVAIRAYQQLTEASKVSSKKILVPLLKEWRAYDGNTRKVIKADKGVIREGDLLSLDAHARHQADEFIAEILDEEITGTWRPSLSQGTRKRRVKAKSPDSNGEADHGT